MIIGLDLSLTNTGLAGLGWTESVPTKAPKEPSVANTLKRLRRIRYEVLTHCEGAETVVIESLVSSKFGLSQERSALWWMIVSELKCRVVPVNPRTLKSYILGAGKKGDKDDKSKGSIRGELARRMPDYRPANDDEADALVLLMIGHDLAGSPLCFMPAENRRALMTVKWG